MKQAKALFTGPVLTAVIMLAIFLTMSLMALGFPGKARLMPLLVGIPASALALAQVLIELRKAMAATADSDAQQLAALWNERYMLVWMLLFFLGILGFGFLYASPFLVFAFLYIGKKETIKVGALGAAGTWAVLFGLFEQAFEIPLFDGLLIEWLAG